MMNVCRQLAAAWLLVLLPCTAAGYLELDSSGAANCRLARDPRRCIARLEARAACADKQGQQKRLCLASQLPPPDCDHAEAPARCLALAAARAACKGLSGAEYRRCMKARLPAWRAYQSG